MTTKSDFTQQIMDFRAAYLRAVARASVDLPFRQELTKLDGNPLEVLKKEFDYECPWALSLELRDNPLKGPRLNPAKGRVMTLRYWGEAITVYIPRKPPGDVKQQLDALAAYYQLNPWFLRNKREELPPIVVAPTRGLDSSQGEDPRKREVLKGAVLSTGGTSEKGAPPTVVVPVETGAAPAMGDASEQESGPSQPIVPLNRYLTDPPPPFDSKWISVDVDKDRYDLGDNIEDFISLAAAIFNAVALAWENEMLWNELTTYRGENSEMRGRTIAILKEWLGYSYPWDIDLIIQPDNKAKYVPYTEGKKGKWTDTTPPKLMLTLPWMSGVDATLPSDFGKKDEEEQKIILAKKAAEAAEKEVEQNNKTPGVAIMGLALYNTDGAGYPFTCG